MKTETIVVQGVVKADGTVEVPGKVGLSAGPVQVTLRQIVPAAGEDLAGFLTRIRAAQAQRGHVPRTAEEIDADIRRFRDEAEEQQANIERLQQECGRNRTSGNQPGQPSA